MKNIVKSTFVPGMLLAATLLATPTGTHAVALGGSMATITGGLINCGTLVGAVGAATIFGAFSGGFTLIGAAIGGIGIAVFCP